MKIKKVVIRKHYDYEWVWIYTTHASNSQLMTTSRIYSRHYECLRAAKAYAQAFKEVPVIVDKSKAK